MVWKHACCYLFEMLPQICTKMNDFKFDFSKIFWGGAHRAPLPRPLPHVFSRASPSVRASPSILRRFAPSILTLCALDSTFDRRIKLGLHSNRFLNPPLSVYYELYDNDKNCNENSIVCFHRKFLSPPWPNFLDGPLVTRLVRFKSHKLDI